MQIVCPDCKRDINADDVNLATGLARCRKCNSVFSAAALAGAPVYGAKRPVELPPRFTTEYMGSDFIIRYRWFSAKYVVLLFFCLFWDGFLVVWYTMAMRGEMPLAAVLFPIIHVLAGVVITYLTVAGFVNHTELRVSRDLLTVRQGPLPFPGNKSVSAFDVVQFFVKEAVSYSKNGRHVTYQVWLEMKDSTQRPLLKNLDKHEQALFIEQEAEKFLNIADRLVAGEMRA